MQNYSAKKNEDSFLEKKILALKLDLDSMKRNNPELSKILINNTPMEKTYILGLNANEKQYYKILKEKEKLENKIYK